MEAEIKNFVEEYNKRMNWNNDIRNTLDMDYINKHEKAKKYIDDYFEIQYLDDKHFDLENAKLYKYDKDDAWAGTLELHVFNNKTYCTSYFWVNPSENEEEYKSKKINSIKNILDKELKELKKLFDTYVELDTLKRMF